MLLATPYFLMAVSVIGSQDLKCAPKTNVQNVNIWELSGHFEGDIIINVGVGPRNVLKTGLWPDGVVPYTISDEFGEGEVNQIRKVMTEFEDIVGSLGHNDSQCQLKFVPHKQGQHGLLEVTKSRPGNCASDVGYTGKNRVCHLGEGCITPDLGTVRHELMHVLGFEHQHSAHNRDQYVVIHWENIKKNESNQFTKADSARYTDFGLGYDFNSIMQYSPYAFADYKNGKSVGPTITPKDPTKRIQKTSKLSDTDKLKLQLMYCKKYKNNNKIRQ